MGKYDFTSLPNRFGHHTYKWKEAEADREVLPTQTHADIPAEVRHSYGLTDDLLRLSIGIEDARDLIADLRQALEG